MASVKFVSMELTPTGDNKYRGTLQALDDQETEQVLVDAGRRVVARFSPDVPADDARLREAVDAALAA